jgi:hypothetical protein
MFPAIPLFPTQASTFAGDVDRLYFLILAVTSFFAIAVVIFVACRPEASDHHRNAGGAPSTGRFRSSSPGRSSRS